MKWYTHTNVSPLGEPSFWASNVCDVLMTWCQLHIRCSLAIPHITCSVWACVPYQVLQQSWTMRPEKTCNSCENIPIKVAYWDVTHFWTRLRQHSGEISEIPKIFIWLVYQPLWKIWKPVGIMKFPIFGKTCSKPATSSWSISPTAINSFCSCTSSRLSYPFGAAIVAILWPWQRSRTKEVQADGSNSSWLVVSI